MMEPVLWRRCVFHVHSLMFVRSRLEGTVGVGAAAGVVRGAALVLDLVVG